MNSLNNWNKKKLLNILFTLMLIALNCIGVPCLIYTSVIFEFAYLFNIVAGACLFLVIFPAAFVLDAFLILKESKQWEKSLELTGALIFQFTIAFVFSVISTWVIGSPTGTFLFDILILSTAFVSMVTLVMVVIFVLFLYIKGRK